MSVPVTTRFAPSPTGELHRGHAYAALLAHALARRANGRFLVRLEDIDGGRCRRHFETSILEDLAWLGLRWEAPVWRQSQRQPHYDQALAALDRLGLLFPCFCSRREIAAEVARMGLAPQGDAEPPYPGTCLQLRPAQQQERLAASQLPALRLHAARAWDHLAGAPLAFAERGAGPAGERGHIAVHRHQITDTVLARRDIGVSYHLAVVVDDAAQGVTLVTRGQDLFAATAIQRLLQTVLQLPVPAYHHHRLIRDDQGRRLAKRDGDESLASLRQRGITPADLAAELHPLE
jgi:glutamyl-Q tRNA(Asp) synthetase